MLKEDLLKQIAQNAYNVGFGVKKHFATYDMIEKLPGLLNFLSIAIGIFALYIPSLGAKCISATLIVFGIIGIYISKYDDKKDEYSTIGSKYLNSFDELKTLYFSVKASTLPDFSTEISRLNEIKQDFNSNAISKQMILSDWYAHYKFFWQSATDIKWIEEELHLTLLKDKIPLSFMISIVFLVMASGYLLTKYYCCIELAAKMITK
jgi:hypothetical protein